MKQVTWATAPRIHYAFRGRLVGLLVLTHCGVPPMPFLPQDKESFFEKHRTQKKRFSFSRSLRVYGVLVRSEERRVGKECRCRGWRGRWNKKRWMGYRDTQLARRPRATRR